MTTESPHATSRAAGLAIPRKYEAWLVDLDGTLYHARWMRIAMALELAAGHWKALAALRVFRNEHERLRREGLVCVEGPYLVQLNRAAARLKMDQDELGKLVQLWMHQRPGKWLRLFRRRRLLREIATFRKNGGRTALVSDYPAHTKLASLDASGLFDAVVANGQPDGPVYLKPHPDGLLRAARQLGVAAENCLVIGDRCDADGEAARRAGMDFRCI